MTKTAPQTPVWVGKTPIHSEPRTCPPNMAPQPPVGGEVEEIRPQVAPAQGGAVEAVPAYYTPDSLIDDLMGELRDAKEQIAFLTRANEALAAAAERFAEAVRKSGAFGGYAVVRVRPDPVPYAKRSPMEHERDEA